MAFCLYLGIVLLISKLFRLGVEIYFIFSQNIVQKQLLKIEEKVKRGSYGKLRKSGDWKLLRVKLRRSDDRKLLRSGDWKLVVDGILNHSLLTFPSQRN